MNSPPSARIRSELESKAQFYRDQARLARMESDRINYAAANSIWRAATEPLTPRAGDMIVLSVCAIIGVVAFLLNVGAFGA